MTGNSTGTLFRITTWGESHGKGIGVVIDGCPSLMELSEEDIQSSLDKRRPGQSDITTPRKEADKVEIISGTFEGRTTGAPISLIVRNEDAKESDYRGFRTLYRPSHADFTYEKKFGIRNPNGGGRSSARITIGRVAAGAIAQKILATHGIEITGYVKQIQDRKARVDPTVVTHEDVEATIVRCPDRAAAHEMISLIEEAKRDGDSLGGVVECVVRNVPVGLGEPEFDKLDAALAKICMSIPATKGFEIGSGFGASEMRGSQHNDEFSSTGDEVVTRTNNSGGVQGGISNGMPIIVRVAFKPTSTIHKKQHTVSTEGKNTIMEGKGRHDPCVLPRAVPIVEASVALVLCDHLLRQKALRGEL